jgi:hypothetical protein
MWVMATTDPRMQDALVTYIDRPFGPWGKPCTAAMTRSKPATGMRDTVARARATGVTSSTAPATGW